MEGPISVSPCPSQSRAWCLHGRDLKAVFGLMINRINHCCLIVVFFSKRFLVWIFKATIANIVIVKLADLHARTKQFTLSIQFMSKWKQVRNTPQNFWHYFKYRFHLQFTLSSVYIIHRGRKCYGIYNTGGRYNLSFWASNWQYLSK